MSRVGKKVIPLPKGVTVQMADDKITVKGPKGQLARDMHPLVQVTVEAETLTCHRLSEDPPTRAAHGLMRALIANMVQGVSGGFDRKLEINGVGYRAEVNGKKLVLQLGFSHPIEYPLPEGVSAAVDKNVVTLSGIDKELLGRAAADVRSFRPPEPYKGKGVKYLEETILRKEGKAAG
jgi:large subunit ribosomal protein L6